MSADDPAIAVIESNPTEEDPLLPNGDRQARRARSASSGGGGGLPGSHRRHEVRRRESGLDPLTRIITGEDDTPDSNPWLHNALSLAAVWVVGAAGWFLSYKIGAWDVADGGPNPIPDDGAGAGEPVQPVTMVGMVLGYFSALCYLW